MNPVNAVGGELAGQGSTALDEELARAELYGVLARLWYAPPDAHLRAAFTNAVTDAPSGGGSLEEPWRQLVGLARALSPEALREEYEALFGGIGKPRVALYGSQHLSGFLNDKPLAALRTDLAGLGLARDDSMSESEDHLAALCEVMRFLIAGDDVRVSNLTQQQRFFAAHMQPWVGECCDQVSQQPDARFYAAVAALTGTFMAIEKLAFDMLDQG